MKTQPARFYSLVTGKALEGVTPSKAPAQYGVPSVTTINGIVNKYILNDWLIRKAVREALVNGWTYTRDAEASGSETDAATDIAVDNIMNWMETDGKTAANRGSEIHDTICAELELQPTPSVKEISTDLQSAIITNLRAFMADMGQNGFTPLKIEEEVVYSNMDDIGYGGRIDLVLSDKNESRFIVLDWKSQKKNGSYNYYPEWRAQLAAYARAFVGSDWINDSNTTIMSVIIDAETGAFVPRTYGGDKDLDAAWNLFEAMAKLWYRYNKYPIESVITGAEDCKTLMAAKTI